MKLFFVSVLISLIGHYCLFSQYDPEYYEASWSPHINLHDYKLLFVEGAKNGDMYVGTAGGMLFHVKSSTLEASLIYRPSLGLLFPSISGIHEVNGDTLLIMVEHRDGRLKLKTADRGKVWEEVQYVESDFVVARRLLTDKLGFGYICGTFSYLWFSKYGINGWQSLPIPYLYNSEQPDLLSNMVVNSVSVSKDSTLYACVSNIEKNFGAENAIYRLSKGATLWQNITKGMPGVKGALQEVAIDSQGNIYATGYHTNLLFSQDSGLSWIELHDAQAHPNSWGNMLDLDHSDNIYIATKNGLYRSIDQGLTFEQAVVGRIWDVSVSLNGAVYAITQANSSHELWRSVDDGQTWKKVVNTGACWK